MKTFKDIRPSPIEAMILVAVLIVLSGCARREEAPQPPVAKTAIDSDWAGYGVRKLCIDSTTYLLYSHTLIAQQKSNGDLIACEVPSGQKNF